MWVCLLCCGSVLCVVCEWYGVQLRLAVGVFVVLWQRVVCEWYGVQLRPAVGVLLCCGSMLCVSCAVFS